MRGNQTTSRREVNEATGHSPDCRVLHWPVHPCPTTTPLPDGFLRQDLPDGEYVDNRDGLDWAEVPMPRRWHRCRPQTRARLDGMHISRCACGAIQYDGSGWMERNSRRRNR